jgi:glycosyltransferase involved in cell wall biosynthesis
MSVNLDSVRSDLLFDVKNETPQPFFIPNPTVSVVIPTKNEAKNLPHVLSRIPAIVDEIVLVDARSEDGTVEVARELRPDIRVVFQKGRGKGNALREGFEAANGDIIVMLDADGSMAPEEIPAFVNALLEGADYAKGSRFLEGGGTDDMEYHRYMGNLGFVTLVRLLYGGNYTDLCYGYCAFWSHVLTALQLESDGFEIETEINVRALKAGLRITEVPSFEYKRIHGQSNLNAIRDGVRVLQMILKHPFDGTRFSENFAPQRHTTKDEFGPAMRLLLQEAVHLARRRGSLPLTTYRNTVEAIKVASKALLTMQCSDPYVRRQQEIYQRRGDNLWSFLESGQELQQ